MLKFNTDFSLGIYSNVKIQPQLYPPPPQVSAFWPNGSREKVLLNANKFSITLNYLHLKESGAQVR